VNTEHPSVGLEEELLLVDSASGEPLPRSSAVATTAAGLGIDVQLELTKAQIEVNSPVIQTSEALRTELLRERAALSAAAHASGARLLAVGTPPAGRAAQLFTDKPRYRLIGERYGQIAREQAVCGCHVHVGVPDRETAVRVSNHLRPWLPTLLALTANSPIYLGSDTAFASWRWIMASRWPCSGAPPFFESADHYDALVAMLLDTGAILDEQMVYWDVRPSTHVPTVEIRVSDVPATVEESVLLATLVRALVMTAIEDGGLGPAIEPEVLRAAYWIAARDGLSGPALDVYRARRISFAGQLQLLLIHLRPALDELGEYQRVEATLRRQLERGNGAIRQRKAYRQNHDVLDVVALVAQETLSEWTA